MQVVGTIVGIAFFALFVALMYSSVLKTEQRKAEQGLRCVAALEEIAKNTKKE